jgi:glyoxylase-like metal-dependent hydrolase (beta-lactamase superfamily II)
MSRNAKLACIALAAAATLAACSKSAPPEAAPAPAPAPAEAAPAAAPKAESTAKAHEFKIGELSAVALRDGFIELPNDNTVFGAGLTPADVSAVLSAAGLPADKIQVSLQPLLVRAPGHVLLFDTGAGGLFGPTTGHVREAFAEASIDPATVTDIFISHSHGDHVGGLVTDGKLSFPNATVHISKPEWSYLSGQEEMAALVAAVKPKVDAFAPGADLVPGVVKAVEIKGHTPGHSGYQITSGAESLLYVGDSMHHSVISVQKPDWTMGFDGDQAAGKASRVALIDQLAASGQRVYAVHFPFPGLGKMQKQGDGVVWVAE